MRETHNPLFLFGGAEGIRTPDLLTASQARSQLRHSPFGYLTTNIPSSCQGEFGETGPNEAIRASARNPTQCLGAFIVFAVLLLLLQGCTVATKNTLISPQIDLGLDPKVTISETIKTSPPKTIAILPFENLTGKEEAFEIVRGSLYNHLSSKTYELPKLYRIDRILQEQGLTKAEEIHRKTPQELGKLLGADALIYGQITHYDRLYAVLYSQVAVGASLRMVDAKSAAVLWEASHVSRKHEGGVSTTAWGIALTAISTALNLRKIQLLRASDDLFRDVVKTLPAPSVAQALKPPQITLLASDSGGTTKKAGEIIKAVMVGDPGCLATFDIGTLKTKLPMVESPEGVYTGTYQIRPGDNVKEAIVAARLTDKSGNVSEWEDVLGPMTVDTTPPAVPKGLFGKGGDGSASLTWEANKDPDLAAYRLYRSSTPLSGFSKVAEVEFTKAEESGLVNGNSYFYRLSAIDRAGNESASTEIVSTTPVPPGPTPIGGEIAKETIWYAAASPYVITEEVIVPRNSSLTIEPGTVILAKGPPLRIRGQLIAKGNEGQWIRLASQEAGQAWGGIILEEGRGILENCMVQQASTGITCISSSPEILSSDISRNGTGISIQGASSHPLFRSTSVEFNQKAGIHISSSASVTMQKCKINHNGESGVWLQGASASVQGCEIAFNGSEGIFCEDASLEARSNHFHDNQRFHLRYARAKGSPLSATENYWGSNKMEEIVAGIDGPVNFSPCLDAPPPEGKPIILPILASPLPVKIDRVAYLIPAHSPYLVNGIVKVEDKASLHILPGVTIKYARGESGILISEGSVVAKGEPARPISFLPASPNPMPGDYAYAFTFQDPQGVYLLEHCRIEHASTALFIQAGSAEIVSCQILTGLQSGIECSGQSASKITRSRIAGHKTGTGIICSGYAKPFLRANNIVDNAWAVVSYMNLLVDARENWWGSDPPAEGLIMGQVDYSSWLKAESSDHP